MGTYCLTIQGTVSPSCNLDNQVEHTPSCSGPVLPEIKIQIQINYCIIMLIGTHLFSNSTLKQYKSYLP